MVCFGYSGPESQAKSLPGPCAFCFWLALKLSSVSLYPLSLSLSLSVPSSCRLELLKQLLCLDAVATAAGHRLSVICPRRVVQSGWCCVSHRSKLEKRRRERERERLCMAGSSLSLCKLVQVRKHCERDLFPPSLSTFFIPHFHSTSTVHGVIIFEALEIPIDVRFALIEYRAFRQHLEYVCVYSICLLVGVPGERFRLETRRCSLLDSFMAGKS